MTTAEADVVVIGDGVIGLSTAFELARDGIRCHVFGAINHGAASGAAAGLLAPSIGKLRPDVQTFFDASLALYPSFIDELRSFEPQLRLLKGLIDVSSRESVPDAARDRVLGANELSQLEPDLAPRPAVFHAGDGAIDNGLLVRALRKAVSPSCTVSSDDPVIAIDSHPHLGIRTRSGTVLRAKRVVLAAGAWSAGIAGLPRRLPVAPLKGQMLAVGSTALRHPVMGDDVYLVPRGSEIAIGATAEHAGFDITVDPDAIERLRRSAIQICPSLGDAPVTRTWAGIRPATPDMLPILGADPTDSRLVYACGHSKNGILLAPATAQAVAAIITGKDPSLDIGPFNVRRFLSGE